MFLNQPASKAEAPLDGRDGSDEAELTQPGFFHHLAQRRRVGALSALEMSLGKPPVSISIADQQEPRGAAVRANDHAAGAALVLHRASGLLLRGPATPALAHGRSSASSRCALPSMN